ncbi:4728_t:CDS:2 [Funneliformis caledonium]|uniref:4728_t:CDS:1 n=1 Tax=Funneliformis caledonium TaxID=1117310 RepID=A0A9N9IGU4_9GLOM|nr:4728_t:CDS:2 [Funneliformis caledonium]
MVKLLKWLKRNLKGNVKETLEETIKHLITLKPPKCNSEALKSSLQNLMKMIKRYIKNTNQTQTQTQNSNGTVKEVQVVPINNKELQKSDEEQAVSTRIEIDIQSWEVKEEEGSFSLSIIFTNSAKVLVLAI